MMYAALAALMLLAQTVAPGPIPIPRSCIDPGSVITDVAARNPTKEIAHVDLADEQRDVFMERYNFMVKAVQGEDATLYEADQVMVLAAKEVPTVLTFAFKAGCLVFQDQVPLETFVQMIDRTHEFPPKPSEGVAK